MAIPRSKARLAAWAIVCAAVVVPGGCAARQTGATGEDAECEVIAREYTARMRPVFDVACAADGDCTLVASQLTRSGPGGSLAAVPRSAQPRLDAIAARYYPRCPATAQGHSAAEMTVAAPAPAAVCRRDRCEVVFR